MLSSFNHGHSSAYDSTHVRFMQQALVLARRGAGRTSPNPVVGAVIVVDGDIVGSGFHPKAGEPHAEIFALREAGMLARGADVYVTLEPCSHHGRTGPCCDALIAAGVAHVFVGIQDPNPKVSGRGITKLRAAGIEVTVGICEQECSVLIAPFVKHITTGQPFVILKVASTLDGCMATSTGESQWITNEDSRNHVHQVRDRIDAIMVGVGTVLCDNPRLTTRLPGGGGRDPLRIVVDSRLRTPQDAAIVHPDSLAKTLIATTEKASPTKIKALEQHPMVEVVQLPDCEGRVDLCVLMDLLGGRDIQSVLVEGGATLNMSLFNVRLIDRVMVYFAPKLIGGDDGKRLFAGQGVTGLVDALQLKDVRSRRFGDDLLIEGEVVACLPD
ncbi:MAG: bifunctional diaminohydroxyphosphoribosylaminopyrimidine deaminase/5-amino-6-(5-phosphoribosylamino)uracil reductase RibD [Thermodesulfobacteriota bacterium]|nr:bifunctional diaminohydroxyphosphoribosylaminopyrimidine deaminase/5-amino-6-(5-phosphoribosylamino)uracil reductase RibD [Thermodesulfobacteriota bacterium]